MFIDLKMTVHVTVCLSIACEGQEHVQESVLSFHSLGARD